MRAEDILSAEELLAANQSGDEAPAGNQHSEKDSSNQGAGATYYPDQFDPMSGSDKLRAAIESGQGVILDGHERTRDDLIASIKEVLPRLDGKPAGVNSPRGKFLTDVCRIFRLPTTISRADPIEEQQVEEDLSKLPDDLDIPDAPLFIQNPGSVALFTEDQASSDKEGVLGDDE